MSTWLLLLTIGAILLQMSNLCLLWKRTRELKDIEIATRAVQRRLEDQALEWRSYRASLLHRLDELQAPLLQAIDRLDARRREEAEVSAQIGSFLPVDETEAAFERTLRDSENHFVAAQGPIQYSSQPSKGSAKTSRREPLIRRKSPS